MLTVGRENNKIVRTVPNVFDILAKAGGLYYAALFASLAFAFVFVKPLDDVFLLQNWKKIKESEVDDNEFIANLRSKEVDKVRHVLSTYSKGDGKVIKRGELLRIIDNC